MDRVLDSPFISLQPAEFTPHKTVVHFRQDEPVVDPNSASRVRRFHHKSRTGCRECKQKRRKCNEGKPSCQGCVRSKIECHYEDSIPPRAQPKNRKRPQRKQGSNRFVFIEFEGKQQSPAESVASEGASSSQNGLNTSLWQSSPSTCLLQGGFSLNSDLSPDFLAVELECLDLFRSLTYRTLPMHHYNAEYWEKVTFESTYSQPYFHNAIVAISASHRRFLRKETSRTPHEISCYVKSLSTFRSTLATPGSVANMPLESWIAILSTSAVLGNYIMSAPVDNFEASFAEYFSLVKGSISLLMEAKRRGIELPSAQTAWGKNNLEHKPYIQGFSFPGVVHASMGDDGAISKDSADRLMIILAIVTAENRDALDTFGALSLLKMSLEWLSMTERTLLTYLRAKSNKAYLIIAHYFGALWKIKDIIEGMCMQGRWLDQAGSAESFWWIQAAESLCKGALGQLAAQPKEHTRWIESVVRELRRDIVEL